ncbi:MAG: hypothetical protein BWY06_01984 [Candidatus Latescibacteria bacterium ADurb.Bin168]|nr:MAG: hypothetical protein BWY06_01984 [Candidatus Latescibacteria bacterium ADurb.Bin168]
MPGINEAPVMALFQEMPDGVVVLVGHRVVRVVPVHPVPQPDGLFRLSFRELDHAGLARFDKPVDAVLLDIAFGLEPEFLLDFNLNPKPLAIEPVLVAQMLPEHGVVALIGVLIRASPGVVHAHQVVRGNGTVYERPAGAVLVLPPELVEGVVFLPEGEDTAFQVWQRECGRYVTIHEFCRLSPQVCVTG